jgi:purine-binding chemotaxis protein CheW
MAAAPRTALLFRTDSVVGALPLAHVVETFRPLPCEPLPRAPDFVRGVAIVRGVPTPVVDSARLLGRTTSGPAGRFVLLRSDRAPVALAVETVLGVGALEDNALTGLPPLVSDGGVFDALGRLDGSLLVLFGAGRIVPDEVWTLMLQRGAQ